MENISLFGKTMCEKSQDKDLFSGGPLDVVRMEFVEAETLRWEDLFPDLIRSAPLPTHLP